mmetsp:Transcript_6087/g.6999  ORF Transcript_6087/g.6999 Transcript_6087/m.6999 type:complete len:460 (-) Transcript_6087:508-1887(-)
MGIQDVSSAQALAEAIKTENGLVLVYFWADFHEACKAGGQLDQVMQALDGKYQSAVKFLKANAELLSEAAESYGVEMVPTFLFFKAGEKIDSLEGVKPKELLSKVETNLRNSNVSRGTATSESQTSTPKGQLSEEMKNRLKSLIDSASIMLFMKGNPNEPRCKFSRAMIEILNNESISFASFDILGDNAVREALKTYSNWKTYPQLYVSGVLVGGLDSVKELQAKGSLSKELDNLKGNKTPLNAPVSVTPQPSVNLDEYLGKLIKSAPVMLFMKGDPSEPRCGFSAKIVGLLEKEGVTFNSFDILKNEEVRQGLKTFSNWPTYPQLYVNGKLIGGLDIVQEMAEDGDLLEQLGVESLNDRLKKLIESAPVMLFMKGNPMEPRCGFSRTMTQILQDEGIKFSTFDILQDEEVRQGLKTYSNWPTYPQLYVNGKLLGGLDIIKELKEDGELLESIGEQHKL